MDSSIALFQRFVERLTGPIDVRFIVQPAMAIMLGIRDGVRDGRRRVHSFCLAPVHAV
jgi:hypothetical protein